MEDTYHGRTPEWQDSENGDIYHGRLTALEDHIASLESIKDDLYEMY